MLLLALAAGQAMAESPFSFDATPGKLPKNVRRAGVVISGGNVDVEFLKTL